MPLIPNLLGQRIKHGRSTQLLVDFEAGLKTSFPSSLTVGGSPAPTVTFHDITTASNRGSVRIATGSAAGNTASLSGPQIFDPSQLGAIWWCFEGLQFDTNSTGMFDVLFAIDGSTSGFRFTHSNATVSAHQGRYVTAQYIGGSGATSASIPTVRHTLRETRKQNLAIGLFPAWKAVVLQPTPDDLAGNVFTIDNEALMGVATAVTPRLLITNTNAASHYFQFTACRLLIEFN